jgi:hypothetical protein
VAIRKRSVDRAREEAIEAFGNGAEPLLAPSAVSVAKAALARPSVTPQLGDARDKSNPRTMLLRFDEDRELVDLLAEVASLEGRKKHPMALRALRIGLERVREGYE